MNNTDLQSELDKNKQLAKNIDSLFIPNPTNLPIVDTNALAMADALISIYKIPGPQPDLRISIGAKLRVFAKAQIHKQLLEWMEDES